MTNKSNEELHTLIMQAGDMLREMDERIKDLESRWHITEVGWQRKHRNPDNTILTLVVRYRLSKLDNQLHYEGEVWSGGEKIKFYGLGRDFQTAIAHVDRDVKTLHDPQSSRTESGQTPAR